MDLAGKYIMRINLKWWTWGKIICVFSLVLFFSSGVNAAETQQKQVVRVAFPNAPGLSETYPDGSRRGVVYEWLVEIAKYTGWEYEFITADDVQDTVRGMYYGEYDLMGGMLKIPTVHRINDIWFYPKYLMGFNESVLLYNKDNAEIKNFDISTLGGKTIGVFSSAKTKIRRLQNMLDFNNLHCELRYYEDSVVFESALKNREVDLLLASDVYVTDDYNIALRFPSEPSYIVARKSDPVLCRQLDEAIEKIYAVNPNFSESLYQKYFPTRYKNSTNFTQEELQFVEQSAPLKVAVVANDNYPFYYFLNDMPKGIVPEIFHLLAGKTGLQFQYVEAASYAEAVDMVKRGEADLLGDFMDDSIPEDIEGLFTTKNYVSLNSIILRNKNISQLDETQSKAVVGRDPLTLFHVKDRKVVHFKNYADCLQAVDTGRADYTIMPTAVLEHLYMQDYYANIVPVVDSPKLYLAIAMSKKANVNLYSVLSKGIVNIPDDQIRAVISGNTLTAGVRKMSVKSLVYSNPVLSAVVIASFLGLVVVIFLMHTWFKMQNKIAYSKLKQAEEISKVRSDFLSRMSHEIRTPLNAIIGFVNLMKLSKGDAFDAQKNIAKIDSSAKFLLSLVNDILDMAKLENGKMQLDSNPFAMMELMKQLEDIFMLMAEEKQLVLKFDCRLLHKNFVGDEFRLKQVLTNLLSNAYKFTKRGGEITVLVEEFPAEDNIARLQFSVADTGVGISKEDQERIFGSFEQVIRQSRANQQGTGLGLAISCNLVKLMRSVLQVESVIGQGSKFYFTIEIPVYDGVLEKAAEDDAPDAQHNLLRGKHILLAEDNDLNAEIAIVLLQLQGAVVEWALHGQEAVDKFSGAAQGSYDVILMDLQMPVKNGLEAAAEIRNMERADARTIPIIAMTANTLKEDQESAFAAGMSGFIPKPFDVEQLYKSIEKFFR